MPAAIPVVASFAAAGSAAAAAGGVAAAMGTLSGFAAISGAVLTGVGALTGKKDVMKVGSLLSLGGAAASAFGGASTTAGLGFCAATGFGASPGVGETLGAAGGTGLTRGSSALIGDVAKSAGPFGEMASGGSVFSPMSAGAPTRMAAAIGDDLAGSGLVMRSADPLQAAASNLSMQEMAAVKANLAKKAGASLWDQTAGAIGKTADFIKKNKELALIGGQALNSAFGPEAELADLKRDELEYRKSLLDRQRRNLNAPIRLAMGG